MLALNCRVCGREHTIAPDARIRLCPLCQMNPVAALGELTTRQRMTQSKLERAEIGLKQQLESVSPETWERYDRLSQARKAATGNPDKLEKFQSRLSQTLKLGDDLAKLLESEAVYNQLFNILNNQLEQMAETELELRELMTSNKSRKSAA